MMKQFYMNYHICLSVKKKSFLREKNTYLKNKKLAGRPENLTLRPQSNIKQIIRNTPPEYLQIIGFQVHGTPRTDLERGNK